MSQRCQKRTYSISSYARANSISREGVQILMRSSALLRPRQKLEDGRGECCRITTGPIVVDILKNDLPSPRHALSDRLAGQRPELPGFFTPHDERRPSEILQHVACDGGRRWSREHQRDNPSVVEQHRLQILRQAVELAGREP